MATYVSIPVTRVTGLTHPDAFQGSSLLTVTQEKKLKHRTWSLTSPAFIDCRWVHMSLETEFAPS